MLVKSVNLNIFKEKLLELTGKYVIIQLHQMDGINYRNINKEGIVEGKVVNVNQTNVVLKTKDDFPEHSLKNNIIISLYEIYSIEGVI